MTDKISIDAYQLWYEFLLLSDRDSWTTFVKNDFGDIKDGEFESWWVTHSELFEELEPFTIDIISNINQYVYYAGTESLETRRYFESSNANLALNLAQDDNDVMVIAIHRLASRTELIDAFTNLLKKENIGKPKGRAPFEKYNSKYSLFCLPDITNLRTILNVYKLKTRTNLSNAEIEEKLKINSRNGIWFDEKSSFPAAREHKKHQQDSIINRHFSDAKKIIENVALGEFPAKTKLIFGQNGNVRNSFFPQ